MFEPRDKEGGNMRETIREQQVMWFLLRGCTNKEIAEHLNISSYTARDHVSSLLKKHAVKSRIELMAKYMSASRTRKHSLPPTPVGLCPNINRN